jgi:hypothetical protein
MANVDLPDAGLPAMPTRRREEEGDLIVDYGNRKTLS